ncbi:type IX secretion system outer membrane channel protein PorV [Myroides sp. LJL119]
MNKIKSSFVFLLLGYSALSQQVRPIVTGVPFMTINADARSSGMADVGVATSWDAYSQQHNPAKYAFAEINQGFSMSYTPYMSKITSGMSLGQLTYYKKINPRSAFGASLRYFGMGDIDMRTSHNSAVVTTKPNEFYFDLSYSLKLSEVFSMGIAGRLITSDLKYPEQGDGNSTATTVAVDVAGFYQSRIIHFANFDGRFRAGFNISNLGPKIKYDDEIGEGSFLPSNLKLGAGFDFLLDPYNTLSITSEFSKLLVPTPPIDPLDPTARKQYNDISWFKGIFESFGNKSGGFDEQMKEIIWSVGLEYWYDNKFALRTGYFHESQEKGARQFATLGAGFKYNKIQIDLSYLFSTSNLNNPLENTLRFSLTFDIAKKQYY